MSAILNNQLYHLYSFLIEGSNYGLFLRLSDEILNGIPI
jgi:hypothetical protein